VPGLPLRYQDRRCDNGYEQGCCNLALVTMNRRRWNGLIPAGDQARMAVPTAFGFDSDASRDHSSAAFKGSSHALIFVCPKVELDFEVIRHRWARGLQMLNHSRRLASKLSSRCPSQLVSAQRINQLHETWSQIQGFALVKLGSRDARNFS
jgi:hypothetical protein